MIIKKELAQKIITLLEISAEKKSGSESKNIMDQQKLTKEEIELFIRWVKVKFD